MSNYNSTQESRISVSLLALTNDKYSIKFQSVVVQHQGNSHHRANKSKPGHLVFCSYFQQANNFAYQTSHQMWQFSQIGIDLTNSFNCHACGCSCKIGVSFKGKLSKERQRITFKEFAKSFLYLLLTPPKIGYFNNTNNN